MTFLIATIAVMSPTSRDAKTERIENAHVWAVLTAPTKNGSSKVFTWKAKARTIARTRLPEKDDAAVLRSITREDARTFGVPERFAVSLMMTESVGIHDAVSEVGARGPMQLMPETASDLGVRNIDDPAQNIMGGVRYLAQLQNRFHGDLVAVAAAYNAGPTTVEAYGGVPPYAETEAYVPRVLEACVNKRSESDYESQPIASVSFAVLRLIHEYGTASSRNRALATLGNCT